MFSDFAMLEKKLRTRGVGDGVSGGGGGVGWKRSHPVGWGRVSQKKIPSVAPAFSTLVGKGGE